MSETIIVNTEKCDVMICRHPDGSIPAPPAKGCFGNPYPLTCERERQWCVSRFFAYFHDRIENDPAFRAAVLGLRCKRLGCFCAPKQCHGDVIKAWLDSQPEAIT